MTQAKPTLIHVAKYFKDRTGWTLLLLRRTPDQGYTWFEEGATKQEQVTSITSASAEEALRLAHRHWKNHSFRTIRCGYRFTLPERDEIGSNALFHQMVASYSMMNGIYFDEELGHQCIIKEISQEAHDLWKTLQAERRL